MFLSADLRWQRSRLAATEASGALAETLFAWEDCGDFVKTICPWGNTFLVWDCNPAPAAGGVAPAPAAGEPQLPVMVKAHVGYDDGMGVRKGPSGADGAGIRFVEFRCDFRRWIAPCLEADFWDLVGCSCTNAAKVAEFYKGVFSSPVLSVTINPPPQCDFQGCV